MTMQANQAREPISEERIVKNWALFSKLATECSPSRSASISAMLTSLESELSTAPASSRREYHNAFPGGLVDHSLRVLRNARQYAESMEISVSRESLTFAALFHDLGKVGDGEKPHYVAQPDSWRRDKLGELYVANPDLVHMSTGLRGAFVLQKFGVTVSADEYLAIVLNDGWVLPENRPYALKEPWLVHVVQTADYFSTLAEKRL